LAQANPEKPAYSRRECRWFAVCLSLSCVFHAARCSELDAAALAAVRGARFSPAREGGAPIVVRDRFEIVFELHRR